MSRPAAALLALACLVAGAGGCGHLGPLGLGGRALPECDGPLPAPGGIEGDFRLRLRLRVTGDGVDWPARLVARKRGDELVLVAFDALGVEAFRVVQTGPRTRVEALPAAVLPVPPRNVLRDLHRVRLWHADADRLAPAGRDVDDGVRVAYSRAGDGLEARVRHPRCGYAATFARLSLSREGR